MRMSLFLRFACVASLAAVMGCAAYSWRPGVPDNMRTVSVPTFRNESNVSELGSVMTRQVLREFQREGTFKIRRAGDAALEVQGIVKSTTSALSGYDRRGGMRFSSYNFGAVVNVSVVDKANGRILIDNRPYVAQTTYVTAQDRQTAARDASGRLAEDLARQVVDDVTNLNFKKYEQKETAK